MLPLEHRVPLVGALNELAAGNWRHWLAYARDAGGDSIRIAETTCVPLRCRRKLACGCRNRSMAVSATELGHRPAPPGQQGGNR